MSATEQLLQRVKTMDEAAAQATIAWLEARQFPAPATVSAADLRKMDEALGFARRYRREPRTTADWMRELREGEEG